MAVEGCMAATAACPGDDRSRSHGRADASAPPRAGARRRALVRRRRTVAGVGATLALAALVWSPSSQALQEAPSEGPVAAHALGGDTGPAAFDEAVGAAGATTMTASGESAPAGASARQVVVAEDDTIWDLARAHAPSGAHPAVYAREVMELNDVEPQRLRAGEVLWLPVR